MNDLQGSYMLVNVGLIHLHSLTCNLIHLHSRVIGGILQLLLTDQDVLFKSHIFKSRESAGYYFGINPLPAVNWLFKLVFSVAAVIKLKS